jgi:hypothetical protein
MAPFDSFVSQKVACFIPTTQPKYDRKLRHHWRGYHLPQRDHILRFTGCALEVVQPNQNQDGGQSLIVHESSQTPELVVERSRRRLLAVARRGADF